MQTRAAGRADLPGLASALAAAFEDDPVMAWMHPRPETRLTRLRRMFGTVARFHYLRHGDVQVTEQDGVISGTAMWAPPGKWQVPPLANALMTAGMIRAFGRQLSTGMAVENLMKEQHPAEPHWYLQAIGTVPAARGTGQGQALMNAGLQHCDAEHVPAYLESSKPENVPYYERFGFTVTGEVHVPKGGPTLWKMWRDPR